MQIALLILAYLGLRLPWMLTLPGSEAPDEPNHYWVSHFLTTHLRLPSGEEVLAAGLPAQYGSLPQFGYLPHVLTSYFASEANMHVLSRLGSVVAGVPTVVAAVLIGKELFPTSKFKAFALPLLVVLHPQLVFTQSYINTDSTTVSLASISILIVVRAIKRGLSIKAALLLGFLLGWLALSKHTGLSIVPALGLGVIAATLGRGETLAQAIQKIAAAAVVFGATCGWWFVRNYHEFSGDILGSRTMYNTWSKILPVKDGQIIHPWPELNQLGWWRYVFFDYWGLFGYMNRYLYRPAYIVYFAYMLLAVAGWVGLKMPGQKKDAATQGAGVEQQTEGGALDVQRLTKYIWLLLLLCPLLNLVAMVAATLMNVTGPHGRYLFPSIIPITALLIAGFYRLGETFGKWATVVLIAMNLAVTVLAWALFYPPH